MVDSLQINKDPVLKFKYLGCFSRDTFIPPKSGQFVIVNTLPAESSGAHWLLIASKNKIIFPYDNFSRDFETFCLKFFSKIEKHVIHSGQC